MPGPCPSNDRRARGRSAPGGSHTVGIGPRARAFAWSLEHPWHQAARNTLALIWPPRAARTLGTIAGRIEVSERLNVDPDRRNIGSSIAATSSGALPHAAGRKQ